MGHLSKADGEVYTEVKVKDLQAGNIFREGDRHYTVRHSPKPNAVGGQYVTVHVQNDMGVRHPLRKRAESNVVVLRRTLQYHPGA